MVMGSEILRIVDSLHREKEIDKELIFQGIETALGSAARKRLGQTNDILIEISRETGEITALDGERVIEPEELGRIAALTAKQVIIQKIREAERDVVHDEFIKKVGTLVNGTIQRYERPNVIVNLGKAEGIIPWREQCPGETYNVGERIKCLIVEVKKVGQRVRIVLSRSNPDILKHLFELEVPEMQERIITIQALARDPGHRSKVAVSSIDAKVDCVGACVGIRGSRIKNIVDELNGEKIDIVRWNDSAEVLIMNSLKPAIVQSIEMNFGERRAKVFVEEDQLALAIGRRGQNVRLASRLCGWSIDLATRSPEGAVVDRFVVDIKGREGEATRLVSSGRAAAEALLPTGPAPAPATEEQVPEAGPEAGAEPGAAASASEAGAAAAERGAGSDGDGAELHAAEEQDAADAPASSGGEDEEPPAAESEVAAPAESPSTGDEPAGSAAGEEQRG